MTFIRGVAGPTSAVDGEVALFDGGTGKLVKAGTAGGTDCLSIGPGASGTKEDICIGDTATATHANGDNVIVGFNASAARADGVSIGHTAQGTGTASQWVAIGSGSAAAGASVAVGQGSTAGSNATAVGAGATGGTNGIGIGKGSNGAGDNIALGIDAIATVFSGSVCIGKGSSITASEQVVFGSTGTPITDFQTGVTANGAAIAIQSNSELLATTSGATQSTTNLIPAGASVLSVTARVTTEVGNTSPLILQQVFDVGDSSDSDRYGAAISGSLATTVDASDYTADPAGVWSASAREVILDAFGAETFVGGAVRIVAHYTLPAAPTS